MDFDGRKGFLRLALKHDVPIVPVVSIGGQETALFLTRGEGLARLLRLDRMFRLKVLPISLALPWGLNVGDMLGHVPLPAKITIDVLEPIDLREEFGEEPDLNEVYHEVLGRCRWPSRRFRRNAGCRCSADARRALAHDRRPSRGDLGAGERSRRLPAVHRRGHALRIEGASRSVDGEGTPAADTTRLGARYSMRMKVGSAEVGGVVEVVEFDEPGDLSWTNVTGIDQRGRWRLRETSDGRTRVTLRLSYDAPGGVLGMISDRVSGADGRPQLRAHAREPAT